MSLGCAGVVMEGDFSALTPACMQRVLDGPAQWHEQTASDGSFSRWVAVCANMVWGGAGALI